MLSTILDVVDGLVTALDFFCVLRDEESRAKKVLIFIGLVLLGALLAAICIETFTE